jgi:hypothetical protein
MLVRTAARAPVAVKLGQQVQNGKTQQVRAGEGIEEFDMPGLMEPEEKDANCAEQDG